MLGDGLEDCTSIHNKGNLLFAPTKKKAMDLARPHTSGLVIPKEETGRSLKRHLVPSLRMPGAIPSLAHTSS
jgi:hypothetical protein